MASTRVPVDVVRLVLDEIIIWADEPLWSLHGMRARQAWLADTFVISRAWYTAGLPLLYRLIEISPRDETTLDLLLRTLHRRPELAGLVRVVRPYERELHSRDPRHSLADMFTFKEPSIPFLTKTGRNRWTTKRRVRKFVALLNLCINVEELVIDSSDVEKFSPMLKATGPRLDRLVLEAAHRLDFDKFARAADWSELRSLRLDVSTRYRVGRGGRHGGMHYFDVAYFVSMTRLVELEVLANVKPERMRDVLHVLRGTLRSLTCNNLNEGLGSADWLSPVSNSLITLRLYVHGDERMCDLGHLSALKSLHVLVYCKSYSDATRTAPNLPPPTFPPAVENVEWACLDTTTTATMAEARVRGLLDVYDHGSVSKLQTIIVRVAIMFVYQREQWPPLGESLRLHGALRGLNCRLELEEDCTYFRREDTRDIFAFERSTKHWARESIRRGEETRRRREAGRVTRGLAWVGALAEDLWSICCCLTYAGCSICHCAQYFD